MALMSTRQQEALNRAQMFYRYSDTHSTTKSLRDQIQESFKFYDGHQWDLADLRTLSLRGQKPITNNKINAMINALSGVEIQTRFRIAYRSQSFKPEDEMLAKALTHYTYFIQEQQKMPYKASNKWRDMLICGIGWGNLLKDKHKGYIYEYINPWNVLFDPDDLSPQFTDSKFVCRKRWMDIEEAKRRWKKFSNSFQYMNNNMQFGAGMQSGELLDRMSSDSSNYFYNSGGGARVLIVEVQWREPRKAYCGHDKAGNYFETFDEDSAIEMAGGRKNLEINPDAMQIMRVLFCDNVLLEYAPLEPSLPNLNDFSYIPCVLMRDFTDGSPYGLVKIMKDPQREINSRHTKALFLDGSKSIIADSNVFNAKDIERLRAEAKRPDSVFVKAPGSELIIQPNTPFAESQMRFVDKSEQQLQMVSGLFNDFLGAPSNAQSGVAIKERQIQSVRNHIFAFDNLKLMKQREGEFLLNLIQGAGDENVLTQILDKDERESIILNLVREVNGEKVIFNDVRTFPLSLYVEEVPDYDSSFDEQRANFDALLNNPNAGLLFRSGALLTRYGIREGYKVADEIKQAQMENQQMEAEAQMAAQGGMPQASPEAMVAQEAMQPPAM